MTRSGAVIAAALAASIAGAIAAYAQYPGQIPADTVLGNGGAVAAPARPLTTTAPILATGTALQITLSSDFTVTANALALGTSGVTAGTYTKLTVDAKGRATVGATAACADLSDDGTACVANTGTSGATLPFLNGTNTWSGTQTFGTVLGTRSTQAGTTYTLASTDCGTLVRFTNAAAIAVTVPSTLAVGCHIALMQTTAAGQITVSAGGGATFSANPHGYTKSFGQFAIIGVTVYDTSTFTLIGDGA